MKSDSSSKGMTKDHSNLEGDIENTLTPLSGSDDKLNKNDQAQGRNSMEQLQAFAQEAVVEERTTIQGNHQELLDRKLKSMNTKAAVPATTLGPFEQFAEEVKEEDRATLDNHDERLEKKLQLMTTDGIVANDVPEDSTKITRMMTGNEPETGTQTKATPGAVAIMGTSSHLMVQSHQFSSAVNVNESTVLEPPNTTTLQQMEEQAMHYPTATLVVDEYISSADSPVLSNATKIDTEAIEQASRQRQVKTALVSFVLAIAAAGIAYTIYAFTHPKNVISAPNETVILNPSASPSMNLSTIIADHAFDNGTALSNRGSPQQLALEWIVINIDGTMLNNTADLLQLYSLVTLYYATSGFKWNQDRSNVESTPWLDGMTYCRWGGVACNADGNILTSLDLRNMSLSGSIPIELGHLSGLAYLDLGENDLNETLPSEIGLLRSLTAFQVDNNAFTGPLPTEIGQLTSLTSLDLASNQFNVSILTEIGLLTNLVQLDAGDNMFTGILPTEIWKLTSLKTFMASASLQIYHFYDFYNYGSSLCTEIGLLSNLEYLSLGYNYLSGTLPTEISQLTNLIILQLSGNKFTGTIPTEIGHLTILDLFAFANNRLTGTVPSEIGHLTILKVMSIGDNNITGTLSMEIQSLTNLNVLDLSRNQFEGTLPTEIGLLQELTYLSLDSNQLGGKIPTEIGQLTSLIFLYLNENQFSGTLPTEVFQLNNLIIKDFSGNYNLEGALTSVYCELDVLLYIQYCPPIACNCTDCKPSYLCL